ncbi:MAG: hypothetical protein QM710_01625 [Flavobacterium sp.]
MKTIKKIVLLLLLTASPAIVLAQVPKVVISDKNGWHKIGETRVDFKNETDKIMIVGARRFASIKIKVTDAPIYLESFDIVFDGNEKKMVPVGLEFKVPRETKVVDFGGEKNVKRIDFKYKTAGGSTQKAHIEVWGYKTNK